MMTIPPQGTPEFAAFVERAMVHPKGPESMLLSAAVSDAKQQYAEHVKAMLKKMQDLVPGQVFRDVSLFHEKFKLPPTDHPNHEVSRDFLRFRILFMLEELVEYCEAVGAVLVAKDDGYDVAFTSKVHNPELALDSLIDLVYVAVGTAYSQRLPFNEGWRKVQEANMAKERVERPEQSKRGSGFDVIKPAGWKPPDHSDILGYGCDKCGARSLHLPKGSPCPVGLPSGLPCDGRMG
jgi:predicted HAD superfamily Cof-like phosphohydrolase